MTEEKKDTSKAKKIALQNLEKAKIAKKEFYDKLNNEKWTHEKIKLEMEEALGKLLMTYNSGLKGNKTTLASDIKKLEQISKIYKQVGEIQCKIEEIKLKQTLLTSSEAPDVLKLQQQFLTIGSEDLNKLLKG